MGLVTSLHALAQVQRVEQDGLLEQKKDAGKIGTAFKVSRFFLAGGTVLDSSTTFRALNHPVMAKRPDGSVLTSYYPTETGWTKCFGERNTFAAVAGNVGLNFGVGFVSERLYRKGGKWRLLAIGMNVFKGTQNTMAGIHNLRHDAGVDRQVRLATGYSGRIVWSSH
jgi:hypothetical protein